MAITTKMTTTKTTMNKEWWAIPDIHGEHKKFVALLAAIRYKPETHQLVLLGDYVDRGGSSSRVIRDLIRLQKEGAIVLRGNHEGMMIDAQAPNAESEHQYLWTINGGDSTLKSYRGEHGDIQWDLLDRHVEWLVSLPLYHETDTFFFSHAPIPAFLPDWQLAKSSKEVLTWSYGQPEWSFAAKIPGKTGICGHIHALRDDLMRPRFYEHYYFLDSGCGCARRAPLIACRLDLPADQRYYVSSEEPGLHYRVGQVQLEDEKRIWRYERG